MKKFIFALVVSIFMSFAFFAESNEEMVETFFQSGLYLKIKKSSNETMYIPKNQIIFIKTEAEKITYVYTDNDRDAHSDSVNINKMKVYLDYKDNIVIEK